MKISAKSRIECGMFESSPKLFNNLPWLMRFAAGAVVIFLATQSVAIEFDGFVKIHPAECWVEADVTDCVWLSVPEDWENPTTQQLKLAVVIYRALDPNPALNPVVYLSGGPGYRR